MTPQDKIIRAKIALIMKQPFFATIIMEFKFVEDNNIVSTMGVDGKHLFWNSNFVDQLPFEEIIGTLVHETMHIAGLHHTRRGTRDPEKWNVACDYAINPIVIDAGFKLPKGALFDPKFKDKTAEEIYNLLPDPPQQPSSNGSGDGSNGSKKKLVDVGGCGGVLDANAQTKSELDRIEVETKQIVAQAAMFAKQQGKLPAGMDRFIEEMMEPKVNWREVLQRFFTEIVHSDYTWTKPNKRYMHAGLYLPSMENIEAGDIVLAVDTSGSISMRELSQFAAEIREIAAAFSTGFKIIWCDAAVAGVQDIEANDDLELHPKGGGGTDFIPPFKYIEEEDLHVSALVYFTDGYCKSFPKAPEYPAMWAVLNNKSFTAPFGEVLHLTNDM